MKKLVITEKTKIIKNEVENYHKLLAKYRKQKLKVCEKQKEIRGKMDDFCNNNKWNYQKYKPLDDEYKKIEKKITKINFYIEVCEGYRKAWLQLYAFNLLKDNKSIITQPLYYKREQARLFEYFNFEGLEFKVYPSGYLNYHNGLVMFENYDKYNSEELLNDKYLEDLTLIPDTLHYRYKQRYLSYKYFEDFTKEKYKQVIKIAKKSQKYIDIIEEEREKLGDNFKYKVAKLSLDYAKDWQKYKQF